MWRLGVCRDPAAEVRGRISVVAGRCHFRARAVFRMGCLALRFCACVFSAIVAVADTTAASENVLHSFQDNGTDGWNPSSALIELKGTLYGVTEFGGASGDGIVYSVSPSTGAETILHSFGGSSDDGREPFGKLLNNDSTFYGTTIEGGTNGAGTLFQIDPATGTETVLYSFQSGFADGAAPRGALLKIGIS
jgi:uncharacterized repeat protein (TIGR03803 family)